MEGDTFLPWCPLAFVLPLMQGSPSASTSLSHHHLLFLSLWLFGIPLYFFILPILVSLCFLYFSKKLFFSFLPLPFSFLIPLSSYFIRFLLSFILFLNSLCSIFLSLLSSYPFAFPFFFHHIQVTELHLKLKLIQSSTFYQDENFSLS